MSEYTDWEKMLLTDAISILTEIDFTQMPPGEVMEKLTQAREHINTLDWELTLKTEEGVGSERGKRYRCIQVL